MTGTYLTQPGFLYRACGLFTKNKGDICNIFVETI